MEQNELEQILQDGESYTIEFKENINSDLSKEMTAFANSSGGRIFIGITDTNEIQGIKIDNTLFSQIQSMATNCDPSLAIEMDKFKNILIITVKEGMNKPYRCTKGFFIRVGANSQKMTTREITDFIQSEGKILFDEVVRDDLSTDQILNKELVKEFLRKSNIQPILDDYSILHNLSVLSFQKQIPYLRNGGVLFFCKKPDPQLYHCVVSCVLFKGIERITILDKKDFFEDIVSNIDNALIFLKQHLNLRYEIKTLQRKEILEIPEIALRELVVNAVCHRDYFDKRANIIISIFDDRVEISNPGGLPKGLNPKDFGKKSITRNPLIASLLLRIGYIEKMGTGILRIEKALAEANIVGIQYYFDSFFTVTIPRLKSHSENSHKTSGKRSGKTSGKILEYIREDRDITIPELAGFIEISERSIERNIQKLQEKGLLKRVGSAKGGHWEIIEKE